MVIQAGALTARRFQAPLPIGIERGGLVAQADHRDCLPQESATLRSPPSANSFAMFSG